MYAVGCSYGITLIITINTMHIKSKILRNFNDIVEASELVLGVLVDYRKHNKLLGYAVIHDEYDIDFCTRKSKALQLGVSDVVSWVRVHGGAVRIFTNANGQAAIKAI